MKYKLLAADLFCGFGGISIGLKSSGHKPVFLLDNWEVATENISKNIKGVEYSNLDLFDKNNKKTVIKKLKSLKIDILAGGPPCQGFSSLGKRSNNDKRNTLVDEFLDIASKLKPKFLLMENVRGLKTMMHSSGINYGKYIVNFLSKKRNNYIVFEISLNGLELGMAQSRKRVFYLGINKDFTLNSSDVLNNLQKIIDQTIHQYKKKNKTIKDVIFDLYKKEAKIGSPVFIGTKKVYNHDVFNHSKDIIERIKCVPEGGGIQDVPDRLLNGHLRKMKNGNYGSGGFVKNIYGRLHWKNPSGTIIAGVRKITCGRLFHPQSNRLLTVRECARLQTFDDELRVYGTHTQQYTLVGNAVPPLFSMICGKIISNIYESRVFFIK
jgi:DNA (cytosine-5)-methyltransferase 1